MTHDEIMNLIDRSLFAEIGYTDEEGRQNIARPSVYGTKAWAGI